MRVKKKEYVYSKNILYMCTGGGIVLGPQAQTNQHDI